MAKVERARENMTKFDTGATRSDGKGKPDYRGFLSPKAIRLFGEYMMRHQTQADGEQRAADNWKKGMPIERYVESLYRHSVDFHEAWDDFLAFTERGIPAPVALLAHLEEAWGGLMFNVQGFGHEWMKARDDAGRK